MHLWNQIYLGQQYQIWTRLTVPFASPDASTDAVVAAITVRSCQLSTLVIYQKRMNYYQLTDFSVSADNENNTDVDASNIAMTPRSLAINGVFNSVFTCCHFFIEFGDCFVALSNYCLLMLILLS